MFAVASALWVKYEVAAAIAGIAGVTAATLAYTLPAPPPNIADWAELAIKVVGALTGLGAVLRFVVVRPLQRSFKAHEERHDRVEATIASELAPDPLLEQLTLPVEKRGLPLRALVVAATIDGTRAGEHLAEHLQASEGYVQELSSLRREFDEHKRGHA